MSYKHIQRHQRLEIEILLGRGYKPIDIAKVVGVHRSSVSREINKRKNEDGIYRAQSANHKAYVKRLGSKHQGMKIEGNKALRERIIKDLREYQSPGGIAVRYGDISHQSIYKWLYSSYGQRYCRYLCTKRYRRRTQRKTTGTCSHIPFLVSVHKRPRVGVHWEADLFVSGKNTVSGVVLVEQNSKYMKVALIPNRRPALMVEAVKHLTKDTLVTDITFDRGIENRYHQQFGIPSFFCDPHSPWQKPYVENNIGLLRKWFVPKKTDLSCMSQTQLEGYVDIVNRKWRKSLGGKSPHEVARESGIIT
jgi:IS30 family transposase